MGDIAYTDVAAGHGNFRGLVEDHLPVVTGLARPQRDDAERDVLQWALRRLGGSSA